MKQIIVLVLALVALLSIGAGCQVGGEQGGPVQEGSDPDDGGKSKTTASMAASARDPRAKVGVNYPSRLDGLEFPTALAFSPDGRLFFTERKGRIRVFENGRLKTFAEVQVPRPLGYHETGLLGVALPPNFPAGPWVYVYHTYESGGTFNRVVRFKDDQGRGVNPEVLLDKIPSAKIHNGGRLAFGPDGTLFITTGDAGHDATSQDKRSLAGKVLRIEASGKTPEDNPFESAVFSYGHRNIFGIAFSPGEKIFVTENGPDRDDEVNLVKKGANYGWPSVTGFSKNRRYVSPLRTYTPNIAPTGATFYTGAKFPAASGDFYFGDWNTGRLHRLELSVDETKVLKETIVFDDDEGLIDVAEAPDGYLYVATESAILRVEPTASID